MLHIEPCLYKGGAIVSLPYRSVLTIDSKIGALPRPIGAWLSHPPGYKKEKSEFQSSQCVVKRSNVSIS